MHHLVNFIHREIAECGPMPFARFMQLALYCPELGFYEKEGDKVGRGGDFYTSVSVGPLFGELLAFQFCRWFAQSQCASLQLVEAGAHDGKLAADILNWLRLRCPEVFQRTNYCIVEPSARRREWQHQRLAEFESKVVWAHSFGPESSFSQPEDGFAVIFSNELLDALPVHRLGWDATKKEWFEWGVASEREKLVWTRLNISDGGDAIDCERPLTPSDGERVAEGRERGSCVSPASSSETLGHAFLQSSILHLPSSPELLSVLPDGYTIEVSPAAEAWWRSAARWLRRGKLLTFDYGLEAADELRPERFNGTLRAYLNHRIADDVLSNPGEQDLTAHVNFAWIQSEGTTAGLVTDSFESQGRFLTRIAAEAWKPGSNFGDWDSQRTRQFQTLTHPDHLGNKFRAFVQSRA